MSYLDKPKVGDRVITRRGVIGTLVKFTGVNDGVIIKSDDGTEYHACIQACRKVERN